MESIILQIQVDNTEVFFKLNECTLFEIRSKGNIIGIVISKK